MLSPAMTQMSPSLSGKSPAAGPADAAKVTRPANAAMYIDVRMSRSEVARVAAEDGFLRRAGKVASDTCRKEHHTRAALWRRLQSYASTDSNGDGHTDSHDPFAAEVARLERAAMNTNSVEF